MTTKKVLFFTPFPIILRHILLLRIFAFFLGHIFTFFSHIHCEHISQCNRYASHNALKHICIFVHVLYISARVIIWFHINVCSNTYLHFFTCTFILHISRGNHFVSHIALTHICMISHICIFTCGFYSSV